MFFRSRAFQDLRVELARIAGAVQAVQDHETRLRRVERYMYGIPASILGSAVSIIMWINHAH